jgi:hypothetical protein
VEQRRTTTPSKPRPQRSESKPEPLNLPVEVHLRAPGIRSTLATVEQAITMIDREMPRELARLPRWTFARALLVEVLRTRKSRDMKTAVRQLKQALGNEKWLTE